MDLITIARRVKSESGRSGIGPASVATAAGDDLRIVNACKDVWRDLQMEARNWKWMRATTAVPTLTISSVTQTLAALGISSFDRWATESDDYKPTVYEASNAASEWPLKWLDYEVFRSRFIVGQHEAGAPQFWSIATNGDLLVGPKPSLATYRLRADYYTAPTELTADASEPNMPSKFHMALVWAALMRIASNDAAPEHYTRAFDAYSGVYDALLASQGDKITVGARPLA